MIQAIRDLFARAMHPPAPSRQSGGDDASEDIERQRLHVAACALLLELAYADDDFTDEERAHVEAAVQHHLDVDEETAQKLLELAEQERASAIDLYQFTSLVRENYDVGQKTVLAEIMWGVVMADGTIDSDESYLLRKIANLLDIKPGFLSHARKRALEE